ncbi:CKLF-like MARVEL transmembrane domain-containing protein 7 [Parasteatoda tepidariorum]|uniref:CKLF-like MARVEL transmembrane domain-containing protein 7 n=1 Tax=Parasteatoda tepidariorum TaxID=114398 RepID=UPI000A2BFF8A|nr:CKLF-like MARVEL transmembrane domain-containing protein 4 isoform X1 [Parasteatoda tepidariorum]XP_042908382.1 CKLF-like MARVEL transmembrane domain-containing protein 4 isoform X2 [Parasteatoda tepidariorum]
MASPNFQVTLQADPNQMAQAAGYMASQGDYMQQQGIPTEGLPQSGKLPVSIRFDPSYIKTFPGMLKIAEIVNNIIGMICIMASGCSWCSNSNWFNFVASTGLTVTFVLLVFYFFHIIEKLKFVPWLAIELLYAATWTLFYMIAALVVAVKGGRDDAWAAAGFFGFAGAILYAADCYTKYKYWKDGIPAQGVKPPEMNYAAY